MTRIGTDRLATAASRREPIDILRACVAPASRPLAATARGLSALLSPSDAAFDVLRICWLSTAFAMFFLYFGCFMVQHDAADNELWADALVSGNSLANRPALRWRDIGYSLILLIGGFPWTHSFIGVTIVSACMGIAMPVLAYFTIRPWFPRAAYWTAMASIVSMAPLIMFKVIHHDQPYNFFLVAVACSLSRYHATGRPIHLYGFALFAFALTLMRLLGQAMYPVLAVLAYAQSRANLRHFIASTMLFAAAIAGYSSYRTHALASPQSALGQQVLGKQVFFNVYLYLGEFNVAVSADLGPNTKRLIEELHAVLLPSPAEAHAVLTFDQSRNTRGSGTTPEFLREHFVKFTADELIKRLFTNPNRDYYHFIASQVGDRLLLLASLEIALRHPGYIAGYTSRNALRLLYDPGYTHGRYIAPSLVKEGNHFLFTGGESRLGYNIGDTTPEPALTEARFLPLLRQPNFVRELYFFVQRCWWDFYQPASEALFCLMMVTWISTGIGLIGKALPTPTLARWSDWWLSAPVTAASGMISVLLFLNVGLTALLVDPLYRYDYSILMLKIMLAGIGLAVLAHLAGRLARALPVRARYGGREAAACAAEQSRPTAARVRRRRHMAISVILLGPAIVGGFGGWVWYIRNVAMAAPAEGTIRIASATLGTDCAAERDNALQQVHSTCAGRKHCDYMFDWRTLRNPAPACANDFRIEWTCSAGGEILARTWAPRPDDRTLLDISCP